MIGGTFFISLNSVLYAEVGIQDLNSTSNLSLIDIPYFLLSFSIRFNYRPYRDERAYLFEKYHLSKPFKV